MDDSQIQSQRKASGGRNTALLTDGLHTVGIDELEGACGIVGRSGYVST